MPQKPPSQLVVEEIADHENTTPTELDPPIYTAINPEALDQLFAQTLGGTSRLDGQVNFTYYGYDIWIEIDGEVTVEAEPL